MKKSTLKFLICFLSLFLTLGLVPGTNAEEQATEPVKFGCLLFLTGDWAMAGGAFREGVDLAEWEANRKGGINGRPIKVIMEDTVYESRRALTGAQRMLNLEKVVGGVIGTLHEAKTAGPMFEAAKVPLVVMWDSSEELEKMGDYVFSIGTWAPSTTDKATEFALQRFKAKRAAVIFTNTEWAQTISDEFQKKFIAKGGEIVKSISINPGQTDFRTEIIKLRNLDVDLLYAPMDDNITSFFRQLKQMNFSAPVVTADNITDALMAEAPGAFDGVYQTQVSDPDSPATMAMAALYQEHYGKKPNMLAFTAWGYDSLTLLIDAARRVGINPVEIQREMYRFKNYPGASGKISFTPEGSSPSLVSMFQVKENKLVKVE